MERDHDEPTDGRVPADPRRAPTTVQPGAPVPRSAPTVLGIPLAQVGETPAGPPQGGWPAAGAQSGWPAAGAPPQGGPVPPPLPPPLSPPVAPSAPTTAHPTAARAYGPADPTSLVSLPGAPPPAQGLPGAPTQGAPRRRAWLWALIAGLVVVALLSVGAVVVLQRSGDVAAAPAAGPPPAAPGVAPNGAGAPPPSRDPVPTTEPAAPADPASAQGRLDTQLRTDAAAVVALDGRWVAQLYAERPGAVRGASTMDATSILRDYTAVKAQYPDALLLSSGDFTSFAMPGYYVVVSPTPYATAQEALAWCGTEQRGREFCFAKLLSRTAGPEGSTVYRN